MSVTCFGSSESMHASTSVGNPIRPDDTSATACDLLVHLWYWCHFHRGVVLEVSTISTTFYGFGVTFMKGS